jgi:hypothetical protein
MNAETVLVRLRIFLLGFAGLVLVGALIELIFTKHTEEPVQWIPSILIVLSIPTILAALARPQRRTLLALRAGMALLGIGSLFGMYEHIATNIAFQLEVQPAASLLERLAAGLGGANPLLAPGILGMAAVLALAATYAHPALAQAD